MYWALIPLTVAEWRWLCIVLLTGKRSAVPTHSATSEIAADHSAVHVSRCRSTCWGDDNTFSTFCYMFCWMLEVFFTSCSVAGVYTMHCNLSVLSQQVMQEWYVLWSWSWKYSASVPLIQALLDYVVHYEFIYRYICMNVFHMQFVAKWQNFKFRRS